MQQKDMDSEFEAYREERNYRRRQRTKTVRPHGQPNKVWEELNAHEEDEIQDRLLTREVHDFFADATKMAADIVSRVTEERALELSERLRTEMEEFLRATIRRANQFIEVLGDGGERAEEIREADMRNLVGRVLDEFRAEGTAQVEDRHLGQDPFKTKVSVNEGQDTNAPATDDDLGMPTQRIDPSELGLVPTISGEDEDDVPQGFDTKPEGTLEDPAENQPEDPPMAEAEKAKLRQALKTMVRQGLMSKDEARETYRARIGKQDQAD